MKKDMRFKKTKSGASMRKLGVIVVVLALFASCKNTGNGELTGVQNRPVYYSETPYGMLYIPMGGYNMGTGDQDVPYANVHGAKTVTVRPFYMDETEITNNEYRQFVDWVRDSIAHTL